MDEPGTIPIDRELLEEQARRLRRLARHLVSEDRADDVVQESLLALHLRASEIRTSVGGWLAGVARHVSRDILRSEGRRSARERRAGPARAVPTPDAVVERLDERRRVLDALRELPEPYRSTVWLRYFEDLPPRKIAARDGTPVETVKSRLKRGLALLRTRLDRRHGGDRDHWRTALLPLAAGAHLLPFATEVVVKKKIAALVIALLLLLVGALTLPSLLGRSGRGPDPRAPADTPPAVADADDAEDPAAADAGPSASEEATAGGTGTAPAAGEPSKEPAAPSAPEPGDEKAAPAIRWNPMDPSLPPGVKPLGGGGPRMIGWSKFPAPPLSGEAALEVLVVDGDGEPVRGAEVRVGPPGIVGTDPVSFAHLALLGTTDEDGRLRDGNLPAGSVGVFADFGGRLRGRRGADCTHAVRAVLRDRKTAGVTVRLPFSGGELGSVAGVVRTPDGEPVVGAAVALGFQREYSGRDGRFRLAGVPAGEETVSVSKVGFTPRQVPVEIPGGGVAEVEVELTPAQSGSFDLFGTVTGPDGAPVASAAVYLSFEGARGTLRSAVTDEVGRFSMKSLPDDVAEKAVAVQASSRDFVSVRALFEKGLPGNEVDLAFEERRVRVVLEPTDAADGRPLLVARFELTAEGMERPRTTSGSRRDGVFTISVLPGTYELLAEAPDHEPLRRSLVVPADGSEVRVPLALEPAPGPHGETILEVLVVDAGTGEPITNADVWSLTATGDPLRRVDGPRAGGRFPMYVPLGESRVKVEANGYGTRELPFRAPADGDPEPLRVELDRE